MTDTHDRASARAAGLRYASDARPGISRRRAGRGFSYRGPDGLPARDATTLERIRTLAIPPAWTDVWICPDPNGHLQATGRDARRRKQYRYHPRWRAQRDDAKFERLIDFARVLPRVRARCDADLARPGLSRQKVLAAVVRLLETTLIRVGNDEYARLNRSFGLTTLRTRHVRVTGNSIRFRFRGKSGRQHEVGLRDRRLASVVRRCQDLPGQELFQYVIVDGGPHDIASDDVNAYLREISGADVTAKDFRTWAGTVLAYRALRALAPGKDERSARHNVVEAVRLTAGRLGNTPAVARRSYVTRPSSRPISMAPSAARCSRPPRNRPARHRRPTRLRRPRWSHSSGAACERSGRNGCNATEWAVPTPVQRRRCPTCATMGHDPSQTEAPRMCMNCGCGKRPEPA